jgi:hypothetical protein
MTMAEMFKKNGYATAHFGKWHCGDTPATRPLARGFDEHAGLMYSNDMWKHHPKNPKRWGKHPLQYWENGKVKIEDVSEKDQTQLTTWSTNYAVDFIDTVRWIKENLPHAKISGGVSNMSFSFRGNNVVREAMHAAFLYHAVQAGMDMGIVNAGMVGVYDDLEPTLRERVEDVVLNRTPVYKDGEERERLTGSGHSVDKLKNILLELE